MNVKLSTYITRQGADGPMEIELDIEAYLTPERYPCPTSDHDHPGYGDMGDDPECEFLDIRTSTGIPVPVEHLTNAERRELEERIWSAVKHGHVSI